MKNLVCFGFVMIMLAGFIHPASAQEKQSAPEVIKVQVSGMVCDFCAQSIFKVFHKETGLTEDQVDVNLDTQMVTLTPHAGQEITDKQITDFIYYAGYDLKNISRE